MFWKKIRKGNKIMRKIITLFKQWFKKYFCCAEPSSNTTIVNNSTEEVSSLCKGCPYYDPEDDCWIPGWGCRGCYYH